jgi:rRNA-processing protein FCF1
MQRRTERPLGRTIEVIDEVRRQLQNLRGGAPGTRGWRFDYVRWAADTERALTEVFVRRDVEAFLYTPRYWEIWRTSEPPDDFPRLFFGEVEARVAELDELIEQLKSLHRRIAGHEGRILVPDTNVFLHCTFFRDAPWRDLTEGQHARVVVPLLVLEQLDRNKTARSQRVAERARAVLRALEDLGVADDGPVELLGRGTIEILVDEPRHIRAPVDDEEIVEVVRYLGQTAGAPALLVTGDLGMLVRARALGVPTARVPEQWRLADHG